jgi:mRNA interferase MazF
LAPRRGEVWFASLDPVQGHEQAGHRPVLILSESRFNASAAGLVTVLPMTSAKRPHPTRVELKPPEGGVIVVSYVICEQVRTISQARLTKLTGAIEPDTLKEIERYTKAADQKRLAVEAVRGLSGGHR